MSDDYLSALMPITSEVDNADCIAYDSIINRLARMSPALAKHLFPAIGALETIVPYLVLS
jgi:hypothetical protein